MFQHEIQQQHAAELMRRAAAERLVQQAVKARRAARASGKNAPEGPVSSLRSRFARAA